MENPRSCIFESFFERVEDDDVFNDDDDEFDSQDSDKKVVNKGIEIDGGIEHGLFLSMKHREKTWEPNTPILSRTFTKAEAGYYFLMYQVCVTGDSSSFIFKDILTTFELDLEFKNYDSFGNASYLTSGEQILPHMFFYLSISYAVLAFLWIRNLRGISSGSGGCVIDENERSDNKPVVFAIHHLMSVLLLLKTLSLFFESIRYHYIRVSGHAELWVRRNQIKLNCNLECTLASSSGTVKKSLIFLTKIISTFCEKIPLVCCLLFFLFFKRDIPLHFDHVDWKRVGLCETYPQQTRKKSDISRLGTTSY